MFAFAGAVSAHAQKNDDTKKPPKESAEIKPKDTKKPRGGEDDKKPKKPQVFFMFEDKPLPFLPLKDEEQEK